MALEDRILEELHRLSREDKSKVLAYIESLRSAPSGTREEPGIYQSPDEIPEELGMEKGWPRGFFRRTAGSLADCPLEIDKPGEAEERLPFEG